MLIVALDLGSVVKWVDGVVVGLGSNLIMYVHEKKSMPIISLKVI